MPVSHESNPEVVGHKRARKSMAVFYYLNPV